MNTLKKDMPVTLGMRGLTMAKRYITPKRKHTKARKYNGKCEHCGTPKPLSEVYCYVDDVNPAINYNAPYLCKECYEKRYGKNG